MIFLFVLCSSLIIYEYDKKGKMGRGGKREEKEKCRLGILRSKLFNITMKRGKGRGRRGRRRRVLWKQGAAIGNVLLFLPSYRSLDGELRRISTVVVARKRQKLLSNEPERVRPLPASVIAPIKMFLSLELSFFISFFFSFHFPLTTNR